MVFYTYEKILMVFFLIWKYDNKPVDLFLRLMVCNVFIINSSLAIEVSTITSTFKMALTEYRSALIGIRYILIFWEVF